jgi:hypothetical protein
MIAINDIKARYGTEIAVILLCCRLHFKTAEHHTLQQFIDSQKIDWNELIYLTRCHRIEPLVYQIITQFHLPKEVGAQIKQDQIILVQQNFKQALETERIISQLNENGIWCVPYKGVTFSKQMYGDIVSRESSDIDLIINPSHFVKVLPIMKENGFSFENQPEYNYFGEEIYQQKKGLNFNKYDQGIRIFHVEFHWRISDNRFQIKKEAHSLLFAGSEDMLLVKRNLKVLNRDAHYLAVLIHHSINDSLTVLRNIVDLSQAYNTGNNINVDYIQKAISDFKLKKAAAMCNKLSEALLGITLSFSSTKTGSITPGIEEYFLDQLLKKEMMSSRLKPGFYNKSIIVLKDDTVEKLKYLQACLSMRFSPSPKDIRLFKLPRKLSFFYAILKPFRSLFVRVNDAEEKKIAEQQE